MYRNFIGIAFSLFLISSGVSAQTLPQRSLPIFVQNYGAVCNGSTDDTSAINAALTYAGANSPSVVVIPTGSACIYTSTLTIPTNVSLIGQGPKNGGLQAGKINISPAIQVNGRGTHISNLYINAGAAGTNTSGAVIATANVSATVIHDVWITGGCIGIDISGNTQWIDRVNIYNAAGAGCGGIRVGNLTSHAGTVDLRVTNSTVATFNTAEFDIKILDAGGLLMSNNDNLSALIGTEIIPGSNQAVDWATFTGTYVGDTNVYESMSIDTSAATPEVRGMECDSCWASNSQGSGGQGITIYNNGGGVVSGIHFVGSRIYSQSNNGVTVGGGTNVSFDSSRFCGNGQQANASDIYFLSGVSHWALRNNTIGSNCDGFTSANLQVGANFAGSNTDVQIVGNDFTGAPTPIGTGALLGSNIVVSSNLGVDDTLPSIASSSSITLPPNPTIKLTGTQVISSILGGWTGRQVTMLMGSSSISFSGGNVCNALTSSANAPVLAYYNGSCWSLK